MKTPITAVASSGADEPAAYYSEKKRELKTCKHLIFRSLHTMNVAPATSCDICKAVYNEKGRRAIQ